MDEQQQIAELVLSMRHFSTLGQCFVLRAPSFLYDKTGVLRPWVRKWFNSLAKAQDIVVLIITNKQIPPEDELDFKNVCQVSVVALADEDVKLVIDDLALSMGLSLPDPQFDLMLHIGGHPVLARAYVRLAEQYGAGVFDRSPDKLFKIQDGILQDNLDAQNLNELQKRILFVLSWLPKVDAYVLEQICSEDHRTREEYIKLLNDLIIGCLVEAKDASFSINSAVRAMFRRRFGYGPDALLNRIATVLAEQLAEANRAKTLRTELVDSVIFMYGLTGKAIPHQFRNLLLPSTLEKFVRDAYNSGREDDKAYDLAINWGLTANDMRMDEAVREEILSSVIRSYIRKGDFDKADELLADFDARDYRSRFFLRGFRYVEDDQPRKAIEFLKDAIHERRYTNSAINQLGIAYFRTGNFDKLEALLKEKQRAVERSAFLLDLRIQLYTAANDFDEAERDIETLARLPEDDGRSRKRRALIIAKRDKDYAKAARLLQDIIQAKLGPIFRLRFLRGFVAAKGGDRSIAMSEAEYLRANVKRSGLDQYRRIVARLLATERKWSDALAKLDELKEESLPDRILRADVLRVKADDLTVGLVERERAREAAWKITGNATNYSDLDFAVSD